MAYLKIFLAIIKKHGTFAFIYFYCIMAKIEESVTDKLSGYINLLTDFGFKRIFGEEANKDLLIDFLNAVLKINGGIKKLEYGNPEKQGRVIKDRRAVYDLYCTTGKGERIIIEMQKVPQTHYSDRSLYYASFPIQEQGVKRKVWDFELTPVISVNIVDFRLEEERETDKYTSYIKLMDVETKEVFYDKLLFVYLELPRFTKTIDRLSNNFDRWMYVLQHLHNMDDIPVFLMKNRIFKKLFEQAKVANMTKAEITAYNKSLKNSIDMNIAKMEIGLAKRELRKKDDVIAKKDNTIAKQNAEIAELKRQLRVK